MKAFSYILSSSTKIIPSLFWHTLRKSIFAVLFLLLQFLYFSCSSEPEIVVIARVGDLYIGCEEFELSYEFNPYFMQMRDPGQTKKALLITLIAEKLVAQAGIKQGLAEFPQISRLSEQYAREAMIEKFWQQEIRDQTKVSEPEVYEAYLRSKRTRYFNYLTFLERNNADRAYQHLVNGMSFSEVAGLNGLEHRFIPIDSVSLGSELNLLEENVFQLDINGISPPFKMGQYYFVIHFLEEKTDIFTSEDDYKRCYKQIEKTIRQRKQMSFFQQYIRDRFPEPPYQLERDQFKALVQQLESALKIKSSDGKTAIKGPQIFSYEEVAGKLGDILDKTVVKFENGPAWTNRILLERISISPYPVELSSPGKFRSSMISATKLILDDEILLQLARQGNFDHTTYVKDQSRMWQEYLVFQKMTDEFLKTVLKNEAQAQGDNRIYLSKLFDDYLMSLSERYDIQIFKTVLDTLTLNKTDMTVIKKHFPKRSIVPLIQPLNSLPRFTSLILEKFIEN